MEDQSLASFVSFANQVFQRNDRALSGTAMDINTLDAQLLQTNMVIRIADNIIASVDDASAAVLPEIRYYGQVYAGQLSKLMDDVDCAQEQTLLVQCISTGGRPKFEIPTQDLVTLKLEGFTNKEIAGLSGVCETTVKNLCREKGITKQNLFSTIEDGELDEHVSEITTKFPLVGYRMVSSCLFAKGIYVPRHRLRASLHRKQPFCQAQRWTVFTPRRKYSVPGPNALWHVDGNHKLVRWGFVVHGGIDGYSRMIVFLRCHTNNRAESVLDAFVEATSRFHIPSRVRTDKGGENVLVWKWMEENCGINRGSFIAGTSVHNQRIERFWRDGANGVFKPYRRLFLHMESVGILDINNATHLLVLHHIYQPRIQNSLDEFSVIWNNHKITTERSFSLIKLFRMGSITAGIRGFPFVHIDPEQIDDEYGAENIEGHETYNPDELDNLYTGEIYTGLEMQKDVLNLAVNPFLDDGADGVILYQEALRLLGS